MKEPKYEIISLSPQSHQKIYKVQLASAIFANTRFRKLMTLPKPKRFQNTLLNLQKALILQKSRYGFGYHYVKKIDCKQSNLSVPKAHSNSLYNLQFASNK